MRAEKERPAPQRTAQENDSDQANVSVLSLARPGHEWLYRAPRKLGCPAGCPLDRHECGVGEPLGELVDYGESAIFWSGRLTSLRSAGVAA